jgi:hypothetical protein
MSQKGNWKQRVEALIVSSQSKGSSSLDAALQQPERHMEIIRNRLILSLAEAMQTPFKAGSLAHGQAGDQIDDLIDEMIEVSTKDGVDMDGALIEQLIELAANIHAVQIKWQEIKESLNVTM